MLANGFLDIFRRMAKLGLAEMIFSEKGRISMRLWEAVFCGLLQGLTEFLPVSSSGHLALAHHFFGLENPETTLVFDILLHLSTLFVVLVVYRRDIFSLVPAAFGVCGKVLRGKLRFSAYTETERMVVLLVAATLPMAAAIFLKDSVEMLALYPRVIGAILLINGILLLFADFFARRSGDVLLKPAGALGIGIFQLAAIVPGLSRSGSTISGGLLFGLSRENAVKFSFLMSIPAVLGANIANVPQALNVVLSRETIVCYLVGMAAALVSGFLAMKLLRYLSQKKRFGFFAYYCMALGVLTMLFA